jgi:hypothetical protein
LGALPDVMIAVKICALVKIAGFSFPVPEVIAAKPAPSLNRIKNAPIFVIGSRWKKTQAKLQDNPKKRTKPLLPERRLTIFLNSHEQTKCKQQTNTFY